MAVLSGAAPADPAAAAVVGASTQAAAGDHQHRYQEETWGIACSDETTALTAGVGKVKWHMPPFATTLIDVQAGLSTAQASGATLVTVDVNEAGVSVLGTKLTFDNTEKHTSTAAAQRTIADAAIAANAEMSADLDALTAASVAAGLKVYITFRRAG